MKKIILIGLLLVLTIGVVSAVDIEKMKMPERFESTGGGLYSQKDPFTNGGTGFNVAIYNYSDSTFKEWTTNDTDYEVNKTGDIYWYIDKTSKDEGIIEVVEMEGQKLIVVFSATSLAKGGVDQAFEYMLEFNKLNNVKAISV